MIQNGFIYLFIYLFTYLFIYFSNQIISYIIRAGPRRSEDRAGVGGGGH